MPDGDEEIVDCAVPEAVLVDEANTLRVCAAVALPEMPAERLPVGENDGEIEDVTVPVLLGVGGVYVQLSTYGPTAPTLEPPTMTHTHREVPVNVTRDCATPQPMVPDAAHPKPASDVGHVPCPTRMTVASAPLMLEPAHVSIPQTPPSGVVGPRSIAHACFALDGSVAPLTPLTMHVPLNVAVHGLTAVVLEMAPDNPVNTPDRRADAMHPGVEVLLGVPPGERVLVGVFDGVPLGVPSGVMVAVTVDEPDDDAVEVGVIVLVRLAPRDHDEVGVLVEVVEEVTLDVLVAVGGRYDHVSK